MTKRILIAALAAMALCCGRANAALIDAPLPTSAYIVFNGLDWAWAFPLPGDTSPNFDLSYQSQFGWTVPTAAQLAVAPSATDFLFAGANVPFNGIDPVSGASFNATNAAYTSAASAGACATPYFSSGTYKSCDWNDGQGQSGGLWSGVAGYSLAYAEQLVVRPDVSATPLPAALPLFASGLGALGLLARRKKRKQFAA